MPNEKQVQEFPKLEGISHKEQLAILAFCKDHIDTRLQETLEFVPEMLKAEGLKLVPDVGWKSVVKQVLTVAAIAAVGGAVGYGLSSRRARKAEAAAALEADKEPVNQNRVRPIGTGRAMAQVN